jgi:hypothetical protein
VDIFIVRPRIERQITENINPKPTLIPASRFRLDPYSEKKRGQRSRTRFTRFPRFSGNSVIKLTSNSLLTKTAVSLNFKQIQRAAETVKDSIG